MRIARVIFSWASRPAGDAEERLAVFEGLDAEARADDRLHWIVAGGPARRASRYLHMLIVLENGATWDWTADLEHTYPHDTVRSLVERGAQLEQLYGDDGISAGEFLRTLHSRAALPAGKEDV